MSWFFLYLGTALFLALVCFIVLRTMTASPTDAGSLVAAIVVAAIAWPVMLIGAAQLLLVVTAHNAPTPAARRIGDSHCADR